MIDRQGRIADQPLTFHAKVKSSGYGQPVPQKIPPPKSVLEVEVLSLILRILFAPKATSYSIENIRNILTQLQSHSSFLVIRLIAHFNWYLHTMVTIANLQAKLLRRIEAYLSLPLHFVASSRPFPSVL